MSTRLDLTWVIGYGGRDPEILAALDEADATRDRIMTLAGRRARAILAGRQHERRRLTDTINALHTQWKGQMARARRLIQVERRWG